MTFLVLYLSILVLNFSNFEQDGSIDLDKLSKILCYFIFNNSIFVKIFLLFCLVLVRLLSITLSTAFEFKILTAILNPDAFYAPVTTILFHLLAENLSL